MVHQTPLGNRVAVGKPPYLSTTIATINLRNGTQATVTRCNQSDFNDGVLTLLFENEDEQKDFAKGLMALAEGLLE